MLFSKHLVKVTIKYPSLPDPYNEVLALHSQQNARFGYAQHELHAPIVKGRANLFYFLVSIITENFTKPVESQAEWILCVPLPCMHALHPRPSSADHGADTSTRTPSPCI